MTCINCHFLTEEKTHSIYSIERFRLQRCKSNEFPLNSLQNMSCYYGMWDEDDPNDLELIYEEVFKYERNDCFFWYYSDGMNINAAQALQQKEIDEKRYSRDRLFTIVGLWITAIALVANTILGIMNYRKHQTIELKYFSLPDKAITAGKPEGEGL
jgi:hypothetical protein